MTVPSTVQDAAWSAYRAGLCVLPVKEDGSKVPAVREWTPYKTTRPIVEQMLGWNFGSRAGFGIIAGRVSGCAEVWDFDCDKTFNALVAMAHATGLGALVDRIRTGYEGRTPNGGVRWIVRYPAHVTWKDCTLAKRQKRVGETHDKVLIELPTFAILPPSHGGVHPSGKPYVQVSGGFDSIASYTEEERDELLDFARCLDEMPQPPPRTPPSSSSTSSSGTRPGDDFNARATWPEVLEPHGWEQVFERNDVTYWRRPGKTHGLSATTNHGGSDLLYVFTSSTPFDADKSYRKFAAYTILNHQGDYKKAAQALLAQGYGGSSSTPPAATTPTTPSTSTSSPTATAPSAPGISLAEALDHVQAFLPRFVVCSTEQAVVLTLWIAHTHAIEAAECTPYLQITSATKRAGKTRLLEVLDPLVARPWLTGRTSAAALVRKIESERPTLLLDESDAAFGGEKEYAETLRGVLNTGYRASGKTTVCAGQGTRITARDFKTFCPKAIAGIGQLPSTVMDRSIPITLRRRKADEPCERWRARDGQREAAPLREAVAAAILPARGRSECGPARPAGRTRRPGGRLLGAPSGHRRRGQPGVGCPCAGECRRAQRRGGDRQRHHGRVAA